jgi:hypothetical protein
VLFDLAEDNIRQDLAGTRRTPTHHRCRRFVAACFDAQDSEIAHI